RRASGKHTKAGGGGPELAGRPCAGCSCPRTARHGPPHPDLASPRSETALSCAGPAGLGQPPSPAAIPAMSGEFARNGHATPVGISLDLLPPRNLVVWQIRIPAPPGPPTRTSPQAASRSAA